MPKKDLWFAFQQKDSLVGTGTAVDKSIAVVSVEGTEKNKISCWSEASLLNNI